MPAMTMTIGHSNQRETTEPRSPQVQRIPYSLRTPSGVPMNEDRALTLSAAWRCIAYLTQSVAKVPWRVRRSIGTNSEIQQNNPIDFLLNVRFSSEYSSFQFRELLLGWALRYGNGYAEIERSIDGAPIALHPLHPSRVTVMRDTETKELYYLIGGNTEANPVILEPDEVFHLRGFGEGPVGLNVVQYAAESLGWAKAVQRFGAAFFGNGAQLSGVIQMKRPMSLSAMAELRRDFQKIYGGSRNSGGVAFLDNEMTFQPIAVEPEKGQFLETNEFLIDEVCRWFGVPPHKVYDLRRATFSNVEFQSHEVVDDSVEPWSIRFEDEANYKLLKQNIKNSLYTKMGLKKLKHVDTQTRVAYYNGLRNMGAINTNEIRDEEDFNALPAGEGGEKYVMQSGMTTLDKIGADPEPTPPPTVSEPVANNTLHLLEVLGGFQNGK